MIDLFPGSGVVALSFISRILIRLGLKSTPNPIVPANTRWEKESLFDILGIIKVRRRESSEPVTTTKERKKPRQLKSG